MKTNRRQFMGGMGALAASTFPMPAFAQAKPKVVVVGGGPGGATVAKYVAKDGGIDVTLVEPAQAASPPASTPISISAASRPARRSRIPTTRSPRPTASSTYASWRPAIDRDKKQVKFASGTALPYDRLVLAPGIDIKFDSVPGYSEEASKKLPHAWQAGAQTQLLRRQLNALSDGATIVMIAPPNPYRCPPGPYERVSMMAHVLKAKGHKKSRIVIIDPKENFSKQGLFMEGWQKHYPGMVEWQDAEDARRREERRRQVDDGEDRPRRVQGAAHQRDPGADGRQDRARRRPRQSDAASARSIRRTCARRPTPTSTSSATPASPATCRSRASRPTARPRSRR